MNAPVRTDGRVDMLTYARKHRLRTRNLHDGRPVPPAKRPPRGKRGPQAFRNSEDRLGAIVGRDGYTVVEGDGFGWYLGEFTRPPHARIAAIRNAGASRASATACSA